MVETDQTIFIQSDQSNKMELHSFQLNSGKFEYIVWQDENPIPNKGFGYAMHSIAEMIFLLDESGIWQYNTQEKSWTLISTKVSDFSPNSVGITGYQGDLFIFGGSDNNRKIVENWKFQMFFIIAIPAISK